ncbi:23S rRNA (cytidine(2498)-2'-O)-methyltransferase RlmM [Leeia sp. TBRC 13508]|uniref:23S rRNA (Cytidine(2498)-2'-O)-methyltransferase RlmM n=1 Tax=Leeia speluncae TaxID=2884804 RepID=A0ABS8D9E3_9NEIS|nr:23S rRNA (cytidine(2498)-2'-O)-methyltransferase RlmM [Leeia speluncae]MCB6184838.1 23S rRNA (cytidine(2498)-2'-O)-methyltransferase RlmM [Leeia speluncae]
MTQPKRMQFFGNLPIEAILLYCRPGFEAECATEAVTALGADEDITVVYEELSGYARVLIPGHLREAARSIRFSSLIFTRQLVFEFMSLTDLPEKDRLTPVLDALRQFNSFTELWLETPDTNDAKALSGFCKRFGARLYDAMFEEGLIQEDRDGQRLVLFWPDMKTVHFGVAQQGNRSEWELGIPRLRMPFGAPSRSTLKLAEAIHIFMSDADANQRFREGMRAVDIGAAPGGWTFQLVSRGLKVFAIDNGPMKGSMQGHPQVKHLRQDGFKFRPDKPVDWLVCDMVEQPVRVANLIVDWLEMGLARESIFNLKLPMKKRLEEIERCFGIIQGRLEEAGIQYTLQAKQLYHDREEITVYVRKLPSEREHQVKRSGSKGKPVKSGAKPARRPSK